MTERSSAGLDERRRRLLFRAWRRGVREMDLIEVPNAELYAWIVGNDAVPAQHDTPVLRRLMAFHTRAEPKP